MIRALDIAGRIVVGCLLMAWLLVCFAIEFFASRRPREKV